MTRLISNSGQYLMIPYWNNSALIRLFLKLDAIVKFTMTPSNPVYINNGSTARLVWDYSDPNNEIFATIFSVLVDGKVEGKNLNECWLKGMVLSRIIEICLLLIRGESAWKQLPP